MSIYLRELQRADLPTINRWRSDENLVKFLLSPFRFINLEVDEKWFDAYMSNRLNNIRLAICESVSDKLLGVVYLLNIDWVNRSGELGMQIGEAASQGVGLGTRALVKIVEHAFHDLNLHRLYLQTLSDNGRAITHLKKVGFIEEGKLRKAVFKNGQYMDVNCMSILKEEFNSPSENR